VLFAVYGVLAFTPFALIAGATKPGAKDFLVVFSDGPASRRSLSR